MKKPKQGGIARRFAGAAVAAAVASLAFAGNAFAATVSGADFNGAGSVLEAGEVDVLNVDGAAGEQVFLSVKAGDEAIAKNLPYTIGADAGSDEGGEWAGVATLDISGFDLSQLDGTYTIEAFANRAGTKLYSGTLYGVYADLGNEQKLIGTRVADASELTARSFNAPETLFVDGKTYRLKSDEPTKAGGALHFSYVEYDEATTVDGSVKYVDADGNVIATTKIAGLASGESRKVDIPMVVTADNGDVYRTVFFADSLTATNPGQTSFSVYCAKMSDATKALAGFYVATINMVDEQGNVIATDSVDVTGEFIYTAPSVIYKTETKKGESEVVTYKIDGSPTVRLSAANDGVLNRARTIEVKYTAQDRDAAEASVTFNLIDGSKRIGEEGRNLGTQTATASASNPTVEPEAAIERDGTTFNIAGSPSDYAYTIHSGQVPSVNVYYVPDGYRAPEGYDVTVNYVNYLTNEVVESHSYASDADDNARITIDVPASFENGGATYLRLDGQGDTISHSFYSGIESYTVYYHNENDELPAGTVINSIRVVYVDGGTTASASAGGATASSTSASATGAPGTAGDAASTATDANAQALQLNPDRTYNVMDGAGDTAALTNESGVDSNTERIEDSETPLSSGFDKGASSSAASSLAQMSQMLLPIAIVVAVAAVAAIAVTRIRRRKEDDEYEL